MYANEACLGECTGFGGSGVKEKGAGYGQISGGSSGVHSGGLDQPQDGTGEVWQGVNPYPTKKHRTRYD